MPCRLRVSYWLYFSDITVQTRKSSSRLAVGFTAKFNTKPHMADKYPKSKLKRKKSAVIEPQGDRYKKDSLKFSIPFNSPDLTKEVKTNSSKGNRG